MYLFLCIIVARIVSLATHWQCYVCTGYSMIAMTELAYILHCTPACNSVKLHPQEVLVANTLLHYRNTQCLNGEEIDCTK